ncbi:MAG: SRPBCC family protein [Candidatus Kryptoniota bacterium]
MTEICAWRIRRAHHGLRGARRDSFLCGRKAKVSHEIAKNHFLGRDPMRPKFQSKQEVIINAPLEKVWEFNMDLLKIAEYHPRVNKVDLISGKQFRETGVSYQCHLKDGKNTCVEKDIEVVPMQKLVTVFPQDTLGITKLLPDYVVESNLSKIGDNATKVEMSHFYSSSKLKVWLLNFVMKRTIARETQDTLNAMKKSIESYTVD